jgi:hypothetical protein
MVFKENSMRKSIFLFAILAVMMMSCVTGQYKKLQPSGKADVIGSIQSTFIITGGFRYRSVINEQAYMSLLAEAQKKYPDINVDIRDVSWVIGRQIDPNNYEYSALGKIIKIN